MPSLKTSLRLIFWTLLLLLVLAVGDFARRTRSTFALSAAPPAGVVFTGQFSRVHAGLGLLERGDIATLLISGTNPGAGITLVGFADQFKLSPALRTALADGTLVLGPGANNTFENAQEARQWQKVLSQDQSVVLITSRFHMPRASLALERALGDRPVLRYAVREEEMQYKGVIVEFWKYLGTGCGLACRACLTAMTD